MSILEGVYLKAKPGKITALIGRNGAGKSTLMKIAAGQVKPSSGITIIDGVRIHAKSLKKRFGSIAYLPQKSMLPNDLLVRRILKSVSLQIEFSRDPIILKILDQKVMELSGGERRYLEIEIIFSLDRSYFLLDEPFTGVEPLIVDLIIEKIKEQSNRGKGVLVTDHLHRYITNIADEAYLMHNKQCSPINGDVSKKLQGLGYLR